MPVSRHTTRSAARCPVTSSQLDAQASRPDGRARRAWRRSSEAREARARGLDRCRRQAHARRSGEGHLAQWTYFLASPWPSSSVAEARRRSRVLLPRDGTEVRSPAQAPRAGFRSGSRKSSSELLARNVREAIALTTPIRFRVRCWSSATRTSIRSAVSFSSVMSWVMPPRRRTTAILVDKPETRRPEPADRPSEGRRIRYS
jgi:hypothetical protein